MRCVLLSVCMIGPAVSFPSNRMVSTAAHAPHACMLPPPARTRHAISQRPPRFLRCSSAFPLAWTTRSTTRSRTQAHSELVKSNEH